MTTAGQFADCSSNNPLPNLRQYAAVGHKHICRKVSEGVGYHWAEGDGLADEAHRLGLTVGHYHWLRPDTSATAQAAFFVSKVKQHLHGGDWLMTDFERTGDAADPADVERAAQLHAFNAYVQQQLPHFPLYVYTGNWYLDGKPHCQAECRRWPIVMSDYSGAAQLPNPYGLRYVAWQFTDRATVPGFAASVDYNRWLAQPKPPTAPAIGAPDMVAYKCNGKFYLWQAGGHVTEVLADFARNVSVMFGRPIGTITPIMHQRIIDAQHRAMGR